jgi:hypothetical protein
MDSPAIFRCALRRRLLGVVGSALLAAPLACSPSIVDSRGHGGGGNSSTSQESIGGGAPNGSGGGCTLSSTGISSGTSVAPANQLTECIDLVNGSCPNQYNAPMYILPSQSCSDVRSVDCGPVSRGGQCCYLVTEEYVGCAGRPFTVGGTARTARIEASDRRAAGSAAPSSGGWRGALAPPAMSALSTVERDALARSWARDALAEHASVASFGRFALELMAVGAPAELVASAHQAALDEVRHAALGFALASAYAERDLGPGPFPIDRDSFSCPTLVEVALATAREGCIGETVSALLVVEQLARATDPAVRAALEEIAEDEARHAELAWKTVAWALEQGGEEVRLAVIEVMREAARYTPEAGDVLAPGARAALLAAHGRLDPAAARAASERALDEVVRPCAARLLGHAAARTASLAS